MNRAHSSGACDAFTIAPSNRLRAATVLAKSYVDAHAGRRFVVVVVGNGPLPDAQLPGVTFLDYREIPVPDPATFHFRLPPDRLAIALVPHAFLHLLAPAAESRLLYLANDGWVYRSLDTLHESLVRHPIVLVPNLLAVAPDPAQALADVSRLLARGIFADGLVGVRRDHAGLRFLDWWAGARDAIEVAGDAPPERALDPVPALFPGLAVLDHPGYHVTLSNLHERTLALDGDAPRSNGRALAFMRFDPLAPPNLDARPDQKPVVDRLYEWYGSALEAAPVADCALPDSLLRLPNGIPMARALNRIVMACARRGIAVPSPGQDPDAFCTFATRPDPLVFGQWVAPLTTAILQQRPDVDAAFPQAARSPGCPGFDKWLASCGAAEEDLQDLLSRFGNALSRDNGVRLALAIYRDRPVLRTAFPGIFEDADEHIAFGDWLEEEGKAGRIRFDAGHLADYRRAQGGVQRVLDAYFADPMLLAAVPVPYADPAIADLVARLQGALPDHPMIDGTDLLWFAHGYGHVRFEILLAALRYGPGCRDAIGGLPSLPAMPALRRFLAARGVAPAAIERVATTLVSGDWIDPVSQYAAFVASDPDSATLFPRRDPDTLAVDRAHHALDRSEAHLHGAEGARWSARILEAVEQPVRRPGVNLCAPLDDASGVGEAARGLLRTLGAAAIPTSIYRLPSRQRNEQPRPAIRALYGAFDESLAVKLTVGNAAGQAHLEFWLPRHLDDETQVGTWVWETETLPARFREAAADLDLILTPSRYAASAIAATVDVPVRVVPNALDERALAHARADRPRFGLPAQSLLFGFFFDTNSVIERKNPLGLLAAFRRAFGTRRDVALVIKVNTPAPADIRYQQLKREAGDLNVIWLEGTLSPEETLGLMASLDAYVSLHRAEGFGLTLAEAMALGVPVVATGYSGNLEFMDESNALLVDAAPCVTIQPHGPYPAGSRWSDPDIAHAATQLLRLEDPALRARLGRAGKVHIKEALGIDGIAKALRNALAPWLQPSAPRPSRQHRAGSESRPSVK